MQTALIHLGAKYSPCMRWDEVLDRDIKAERLKERDTACCIRKDRAGCVQSPKTECSKVGRMGGDMDDMGGGGGGVGDGTNVGGGPPRSNWVSEIVIESGAASGFPVSGVCLYSFSRFRGLNCFRFHAFISGIWRKTACER